MVKPDCKAGQKEVSFHCGTPAGATWGDRGMGSCPLQTATVPGLGEARIPPEFAELVHGAASIVVMPATGDPTGIFEALREGNVVVLTGPWLYLDGIMRYLQHRTQKRKQDLIDRATFAHIENRFARAQAMQMARQDAVARTMIVVKQDAIWRVSDYPDIKDITVWIDPEQPPLSQSPFLLPLRRLQRILTDSKRAQEGLYVRALDARLTILPHVYVPHDQSVVDLLASSLGVAEGARVLDMGTGTGVLAFVAARAGAQVIATDNSAHAVQNAKLNVERLALKDQVEVRGPADLFDSVQGEQFDVIIFNAPWVYGKPKTLYDAAIYDEELRVIKGFMSRVRDHLVQGGRALLLYSSISELTGFGGLTLVRRLAADNGLEIVSDRYITRVGRVLGMRERVYLLEMQAVKDTGWRTCE